MFQRGLQLSVGFPFPVQFEKSFVRWIKIVIYTLSYRVDDK